MTSVRSTPLVALLCVALSILAFSPSLFARDAASADRRHEKPAVAAPQYLTGTVILKLRAGVANNRRDVLFDVPSLDAVMQEIGAHARRPMFPLAPYSPYEPTIAFGATQDTAGFDRTYVISYNGPFDAMYVRDRMIATQTVAFAEPYYIFTTDNAPVNDPQAAQQYWLSIIKAQEAWDVTQGSSEIVIAIVDSGVDWTHEDLSENIWQNPGEIGRDALNRDMRTNNVDDDNNGNIDDWHGWDFVGNASFSEQFSGQFFPDNNPAPRAVNVQGYSGYHGTTVSGCASARTNNGKGIASPGYSSSILPVKAAADSNVQAILAGYDGIRYAADMHATIINCSFGGPAQSGVQAIQQIIDYATAQGSLVIAASGNSGQNVEAVPHVPSSLVGVLSVGATSASDYADTTYTNSGLGVHVYAPGTNILTTYPNNAYIGNGVTGTSFSSPITSGVAALVFAVHPDWSGEQVATQLRVTGDRVKINNGIRFAPHFYRRINAQRAVLINRSLTSGQRFPGIKLESFTINDKIRDTVKSLTGIITVQLNLRNVLAPTSELKIDAFPGQMLRAVEQVSTPVIGTGATATAEVQLQIDPNAAERFSDGAFDLVMRFTDGEYEDLIPIRIPVRLAGWKQQANFTGGSSTYSTHGVATPSPNVGWVVANIDDQRPVYSRTIDGKGWTTMRPIATANEPAYCVAAFNDKIAWAGTGPSTAQAGVYRTTNGGTAWTRSSVSGITPFVNAIHFYDSLNGIVIGDPRNSRWGIGVTNDGGATWAPIAQLVAAGAGEAGWNNSFAVHGDNVWFGTNNNRVFRSTDRGQTWTSSQTPATSSFSFAFSSETEGIAVFKRTVVNNSWSGANMTAITRNGGETWQAITLPFGVTGESLTNVPGSMRIMLSTESGMLETSDLGQTWKVIPSPSTVFNWKATQLGARISPGVGIAASTNAGVVAAFGVNSKGRIIGYREEAPAAAPMLDETARDARLLEPFPNPTASTTTISFELAAPSNVTLELYDAHGSIVRTLIADRREAGRHAIVVDATTIAAGNYHVVLVADGKRDLRTITVVK